MCVCERHNTRTHIKLAQVGFLFTRQDLERRGLANTVGPHQPQNFSRSRNGQPAHKQWSVPTSATLPNGGSAFHVPVQFEGIGAVSVCGFLLQVTGQVNNGQRPKRTFLQRHRRVTRREIGEGPSSRTLMQMPQPMQSDSEIHTILLCGVTSIHSLPAEE